MKSYSAGGLVKTLDGKYVTIEQDPDIWSIPKGHIEKGETREQTAKREIQEESGIQKLKLIKYLGMIKRKALGNPNEIKYIYVFLFETEETSKNIKNNNVKCVTIEEMIKSLYFKEDREFINKISKIL